MVLPALAHRYDEILHVLRTTVVPLVESDGGQMFVLPGDESRVAIHLAGRLAGSPGTALLGRRILEPAIHAVAPEANVTVSSGWRIPEGAVRLKSES